MSTVVQRRGAPARAGQSASRVILISAIFGLLLVSASLAGYGFVTHGKPDVSADHYRRGTVQYAPDEKGQCERFEFDNQTGEIRQQGATGCDPNASAPPPSVDSGGTLGGIRDYFRSH